ncbi:protein-tyrosine sulfotransferase 1-like [Anneissia japonica]|uniref:protein-tyrosine sulfotransferase 1-like n=1 Tax=Anneissia japonica TaxID=1529436 RepID=UPI001425A040|nr:protein-tyrosine sulfotransferase 1-like [Anneissia japonica]XP_033112185.1 protein-tyrosine sulfotransferase 1-like [Anneissia japonica]
MARQSRMRTLLTVALTAVVTIMITQNMCDVPDIKGKMVPKESMKTIEDDENRVYEYHKDMPLIFIGGMPRSGTTLMRAMLDAHPEIRCGEETRLVPRLLGMRVQWRKSKKEQTRLLEAGLTDAVIDDALRAFILEIIAKHGDAAPRLCNKDPFTLKSMMYLKSLFPNAKYIFMIRDGRATVNSIISRKVTISGFDITSWRDCLKKWNLAVEAMHNQCMSVGSRYCLPVYYEQLVLHPEQWLRKILHFLDIDFDDSVLHHDKHVGMPGGIRLSKKERSTDQVIKPVNLDALTSWVGKVPADVIHDMASIAPMLRTLGYDPYANPPNYGNPDQFVLDNTKEIHMNAAKYKEKLKEVIGQEPVDPDYVVPKKPIPKPSRGRQDIRRPQFRRGNMPVARNHLE